MDIRNILHKNVWHEKYGRGEIEDWFLYENRFIIAVNFHNKYGVHHYNFPEDIIRDKLDADEDLWKLISKYYTYNRLSGIVIEKQQLLENTFICKICGKTALYTTKEQAENIRKGIKFNQICKQCRHKAWEEEHGFDFYRSLMWHDMPSHSKKRRAHETDGMNLGDY